MIRTTLLLACLCHCSSSPCEYSGSCVKNHSALETSCKEQRARSSIEPHCSGEYDEFLRCKAESTVCTADGRIDTNATYTKITMACAAKRTPYVACCSNYSSDQACITD